MNTGPDLDRVAARLVVLLGADRCVVIGGIAVAAHGYVRATDDIDVVVNYPLAEARRVLDAAGIPVQLKRGDVLEGDFPCLKGTLEGVPFDVLPALVPLEWENAIELAIEDDRLPIVDLEGLLRLKLRAQGPQDLLDVAVLVLRHPEYRERAREIAAANRVLERLDSYLTDRRTQATAEQERVRDEMSSGTTKSSPKRRARRH